VNPDRSALSVVCEPAAGGFRCLVTVGDDGDATHHEVNVGSVDVAALSPLTDQPETLVRESFRFLLERESRESILSRFDLTVISRYLPEYAMEIRRRMVTGRAS
jgi:hypothetical protein